MRSIIFLLAFSFCYAVDYMPPPLPNGMPPQLQETPLDAQVEKWRSEDRERSIERLAIIEKYYRSFDFKPLPYIQGTDLRKSEVERNERAGWVNSAAEGVEERLRDKMKNWWNAVEAVKNFQRQYVAVVGPLTTPSLVVETKREQEKPKERKKIQATLADGTKVEQ